MNVDRRRLLWNLIDKQTGEVNSKKYFSFFFLASVYLIFSSRCCCCCLLSSFHMIKVKWRFAYVLPTRKSRSLLHRTVKSAVRIELSHGWNSETSLFLLSLYAFIQLLLLLLVLPPQFSSLDIYIFIYAIMPQTFPSFFLTDQEASRSFFSMCLWHFGSHARRQNPFFFSLSRCCCSYVVRNQHPTPKKNYYFSPSFLNLSFIFFIQKKKMFPVRDHCLGAHGWLTAGLTFLESDTVRKKNTVIAKKCLVVNGAVNRSINKSIDLTHFILTTTLSSQGEKSLLRRINSSSAGF